MDRSLLCSIVSPGVSPDQERSGSPTGHHRFFSAVRHAKGSRLGNCLDGKTIAAIAVRLSVSIPTITDLDKQYDIGYG